MYLKRHAEATVKNLAEMFGAVLVAGPRQVGKTTMLQNITQNAGYVSLDDPILRASAAEESGTFFKDNPPPSSWTKYRKPLRCLSRSSSIWTEVVKKGSFIFAALSSSA